MSKKPNYEVILRTKKQLILKDLGPWDTYFTITNSAESVVKELYSKGLLNTNMKLMYYDSNNQLDEIVHSNGEFKHFKVGKR